MKETYREFWHRLLREDAAKRRYTPDLELVALDMWHTVCVSRRKAAIMAAYRALKVQG